MNVLSIFDGISCGRVALDRAGINVGSYYASEIDKFAIKVSESNYPDIIRLGDVTKWREWDIDWSSIDLVTGGSPCQGFSFAGKQLAFDDPRSKLFFEMVLIIKKVLSHNPDAYFLLENVKMKKEFEAVITEFLGVKSTLINSSLLSAQNRNRLYWFGKGSEVKLLDFEVQIDGSEKVGRLQETTQGEGSRKVLGETQRRYSSMQNLWEGLQENRQEGNNEDLLRSLLQREQEISRQEAKPVQELCRVSEEVSCEELRKNSQLSTQIQENGSWEGGDAEARPAARAEDSKVHEDSCKKTDSGCFEPKDYTIRYIENIENEDRVQGVSHGEGFVYRPCDSIIEGWSKRIRESTNSLQGMQFIKKRQDDGGIYGLFRIEVQRIGIEQPEDRGILLKDILEDLEADRPCELLKNETAGGHIANATDIKGHQSIKRVYNPEGKAPTLTTMGGGHREPKIMCKNGKYRKLSIVEMERLQTLDDNYTAGVSDTQRKKMIGNGWTVDVIAHILSFIK